MALNVDLVSCKAVGHILIHADNKPNQDLVDELEDIDQEELAVAREELFHAACSRFQEQLLKLRYVII